MSNHSHAPLIQLNIKEISMLEEEEKTAEELDAIQEEKEQKSRNRIFWLLVGLCALLVAGIIYELIATLNK